MSGHSGKIKPLLFLLLSSVLFALSFPSFINKNGFPFLGYIALAPMFAAIHLIRLRNAPWLGFLYGLISYALFNYWLGIFYPPAIVIIPSLYAAYFFVLFPLLKGADMLFPKYGFLVQSFIWIGYEYFRTKGFLGYPYGIMGYSQYAYPLLIRVAAVTGVWGVSFLLVYPSALIGRIFRDGYRKAGPALRNFAVPSAFWAVLMCMALVYGAVTSGDYSGCRTVRLALIQQNIDPWQGGTATYRESLDRLTRQSTASLAERPDMVVWSETSFVPSVDWHRRYRTDADYYKLVKELLDFMKQQEIPYVIGNNEGVLGYDEYGRQVRQDYNSALLFQNGDITDVYRKIHLVPFTEHFPYKKQLPFIYDFLVSWDTHFWRHGTEYTVFDAAGVKFSTPICFEDSFSDISRGFVRNGAQMIVNLSNDGWAFSVPSEMQHMAMAVFRACENRRTVVRSTNSGMTCVIEPSGRILSMAEPFKELYMVYDAPVYDDTTTIYTKYGDWFAVLCSMLAAAFVSAGIFMAVFRRCRHAE
ncbi:MAG: apolipoprotein N-acyltransferase [Spirochaetia bacterium]|nr:apolipoprotein N-acyltransferase [Spirochaetia bacterium]